jgi:folate-dependent phosphoribosylglycinamide formyltransferase PurN
LRLVLLTPARLGSFELEVYDSLISAPEVDVVGAIVDARLPLSPAGKVRRELRRGRGAYVVVMSLQGLAAGVRTAEPARRYLTRRGIDAIETADLYAPETLDEIRSRRPDCLVRSGFGIIKEPVLSLAPLGVLSYHHGNIRRYRGAPVGFWELYNHEPTIGVTVQILTPVLDGGQIVVERTLRIAEWDTWRSLTRRLYAASTDMMLEACLALAAPSFTPETVPPAALGELFTLPTVRQWLTLQVRLLQRRAPRRRQRTPFARPRDNRRESLPQSAGGGLVNPSLDANATPTSLPGR